MVTGQADLFKDLRTEEVEALLALGSRFTLSSGAELFGLGDPADSIYVIARGRIRLTLPIKLRGRAEDVMVEERCSGQTVGWSALIPPYRFTLKATAPLDSELIALSREDLNRQFVGNPRAGYTVALNLASVIGQRLQIFQAMWLREMQRTVDLSCV
jgi:CRP-like cAMP-binding protein